MERRRPRRPPSRPLVLIVDGHADNYALYALGLSAMGFDVLPAGGDADAWERAWTMHPDVIVTESTPPLGDGRGLLDRLREDARTRDIPVVAVSPCPPGALATELRRVLACVAAHQPAASF